MVVHPFVLVGEGFSLEKLVLDVLGAVCQHMTRKCTGTQNMGGVGCVGTGLPILGRLNQRCGGNWSSGL